MTETHGILDHEHEMLLEELDGVTRRNDRVGEIYSEVLRLFRTHLTEESETVVPLLRYLKDRLGVFDNNAVESLRLASARFEDHFDRMLEEHGEISRQINLAIEELKIHPDEIALHLAHELLHHVELEEEVLYPAAFASGDLIEFER